MPHLEEPNLREEVIKSLSILQQGGILLYPTETIWGLGVDATNELAVSNLYHIKQREGRKAMIILLDNIDNVVKYVRVVPDMAWQLWEVTDKPLTLILPDAICLAPNLISEDGSIAIRITSNIFCQSLIRRLGRPLVSTSANISSSSSPTSYSSINPLIIKSVDYVVNPCLEQNSNHSPSSIIKILRNGEVNIIRDCFNI